MPGEKVKSRWVGGDLVYYDAADIGPKGYVFRIAEDEVEFYKPFTITDLTLTGILTVPNSGLHILDTDASHDLIIKPGSDLTADRTLTLTTGDAARTITLSGNPTLADWFDQAVKQASSPTFAGLTLTGNITMPDDGWTGLGVAKGRLEFEDEAIDRAIFWDCDVGFGIAPIQDLHLYRATGDVCFRIESDGVDSYVFLETVNDAKAWRFGTLSGDGWGIWSGAITPFSIWSSAPTAALSIQNDSVDLTVDLELAANSIKGTSVDISNAELQQLSNIGAAAISSAEWGYVAGMQAVGTGDSPTFAGLTLTGDFLLANGNYVGISAAERLEFYTAGYAAFMGCVVVIGATAPTGTGTRLHVKGAGGTNINGIRIEHGHEGSNWDLTIGGTGNSFPGGFAISDEGTARVIINTTGDMGVNDTTPSFKLDVNGTGQFTGKLTLGGGTDPPYVLYDLETRQSIIDRIKREVPKGKLGGAAMFFNSDTKLLEAFVPKEGKFYDLTGKLLDTTDPVIDTYPVKKKHYFFEDTGEIKAFEVPDDPKKYKLAKGVRFNPWTGKFMKEIEEEVSKEKALEDIEVEVKLKDVVGFTTEYKLANNGEVKKVQIPIFDKRIEIQKRLKTDGCFYTETGKFFKKSEIEISKEEAILQ